MAIHWMRLVRFSEPAIRPTTQSVVGKADFVVVKVRFYSRKDSTVNDHRSFSVVGMNRLGRGGFLVLVLFPILRWEQNRELLLILLGNLGRVRGELSP